MFGYVIPVKCELKVKEFDQFRAAYCGLCHSLRDSYGISARFILNYDFTFLAMLLATDKGEVKYKKRRCIAHPFRSKTCSVGGQAFRQAAGMSVILAHWRLRDAVDDRGFLKSLPYRTVGACLGRAYRRAAKDFPAFDTHCREQLDKLHALEQANSDHLDQVADTFAQILPHAACEIGDQHERRTLEELLYHIGRWIYLIDAYDDLEEDQASGNFNPLRTRFNLTEGKLSDTDKAWILTTLNHSINRLTAAYNLKGETAWSGILENIIYLGLPSVTQSVLSGRFVRKWGRWSHRKEQKSL